MRRRDRLGDHDARVPVRLYAAEVHGPIVSPAQMAGSSTIQVSG